MAGQGKRVLATFHRRRCYNIRSIVNLQDVYHINSSENIADMGTKGRMNLSQVGPNSKWYNGPSHLKLVYKE